MTLFQMMMVEMRGDKSADSQLNSITIYQTAEGLSLANI